MRLRDVTIWLVCVLVGITLLVIAGMQLDYINSQRQELKLIVNEAPENASPSLAFATVALGAFRGLVVDILWMRADALKEQGQFFDARQLAEWITTLQPRFAAVWDFHSWNMAYNISVAIPSSQPEERWRWVKNGYELLRDKGIPLNPRSIVLYRQLAMTFQHKIGGVSDDAHKYYKLQLATSMEPLLRSADNRLEAKDNRYFEALVKSPAEWSEIENDAEIGPLIKALESADGRFKDKKEFVGNYLSLRQNPGRLEPAAFEVIDSLRGRDSLKKFDIFAKAYQLRHVWKLEPELMLQLNRIYGPIDWSDPNRELSLDWRHPDSHSIYWAVLGLQRAGRGEFSVDEANTDRMVVHSLQNLFRYGKIYIYRPLRRERPESPSEGTGPERQPEVFLRPDLRMFEPYNRAILKVIEKYEDPNDQEYTSHQIGHRNMLKNAVFDFYQAGHVPQAQKIYIQLRQLYPREDFKVPLADFARDYLLSELEGMHIINARRIVQLLLRQGYFLYAIRDDAAAFGTEKLAAEVYDYYHRSDKPEYIWELPEFSLLKYFALVDFLNDQQYSVDLRGALFDRIRVERPDLYKELDEQRKLLKESE
ncbi:MAG: hypothetical protein ACYSP9_00145 [Planctomycetota bacterium]|jgi:hypothetical protein